MLFLQELKDIITNNRINSKIQVWSCLLDQPEQAVSGYYTLLSSDEKKRAAKLKLTELRKRWIVSRGVLRSLLANYYNCPPKEIQLQYNEYGKPSLLKVYNQTEISFNLSHSKNLAVYIFTEDRRIGIDLEKTEDLSDLEGLADLCFSEYEKKWFNNIPQAKKKEIFYRIWTCKEAYIKAIGKGFSFSPNNITLDLNSEQQLFFKEIMCENNVSNWKIVEFRTHPDFISSAVIELDDFTI